MRWRPAALLSGRHIVWGASLVQLPTMGLALPVWEYPPEELASDVGFHVTYGIGVTTAYEVLDR